MPTRRVKKSVVSKIEVTKKGGGLIQYRNSITSMTKKIKDFSVSLSPNLLSVKMSMMGAVREVEKMMHERRKG